jgi:hypothetical protein
MIGRQNHYSVIGAGDVCTGRVDLAGIGFEIRLIPVVAELRLSAVYWLM